MLEFIKGRIPKFITVTGHISLNDEYLSLMFLLKIFFLIGYILIDNLFSFLDIRDTLR
jgi:hypothetical protein